jgi:FMNH2-dependent dimethyl sulfone monooxygenase
MKDLAWTKYKRESGTFTYSYAVVRDTEKGAKDYYNYYVYEKGDWEAADNICKIFGIESGSYTQEYLTSSGRTS